MMNITIKLSDDDYRILSFALGYATAIALKDNEKDLAAQFLRAFRAMQHAEMLIEPKQGK